MNMDDTRPIYANESETVVFRAKDFKHIIEEHMHLLVTELLVMGKDPYPEWKATQTEMQPDRAWYFQATFQTPEGDKEAEVNVGLKENTLRVYSHSRPKLKVFKERDRERAKEGIPDLTLDYINQLEYAGRMGWLVWKEAFDTLHNVPDLRLADVKDEFQRVLDSFYQEFKKVGFLLPDSNLSDS